ncbi:MAG TPA: twin-arginine translocation signal domain-containing protein [Methylomirabilota bacterium]|nr:twin-arginine translocation signal domain-containing protein [Methylomirabilota bacterium]
MTTLSRRQFLKTTGTVVGATLATSLVPAHGTAAGKDLVPRKFPFPPNDQYGSYEPTITGDGNTIYFARFAGTGDKRVVGTTTDIFVSHRIRKDKEWPGMDGDWSVPERLPDTVNSEHMDQEPRISPDGKTLYFMSRRPGSAGGADIYVAQKQPSGEWSKAQMLGPNVNTSHSDHCFMPSGIPGEADVSAFVSVRPREAGGPPSADVYTTRFERGVWQPAKRVESKLLDSIGFKCRLNSVNKDGLVLGVVSVHDFGKFHTMVFVHYDPATRQWKGPLVEAPFNNPAIDGACPMFSPDGDRMIWSSGLDRGPGPVSTSGGTGSLYDLFWLKTSDMVAYYRAKAGLK